MYISYIDKTTFNGNIAEVKNKYFATRITEYASDENKFRTYISYVLLKDLVKDKLNRDLDAIKIVRDQHNKPVVEDGSFCFNISHSQNIVCVALSATPVGVDVEKLRPFDERIADKFFANAKNSIYNSQNTDREFTKHWTIFESGLKLFGDISLFKQNTLPIYKKSFDISDQNFSYVMTISSLNDDEVILTKHN